MGWTIFGNTDLSEVKGLETIKHEGPSTIGIDTLFYSKGQIPEAFLRGAGVPEILITYLPSMLGQPNSKQLYTPYHPRVLPEVL